MKVVSAGVGIVLLGASLSLAYLSSNNANEMIAKKDAIVMHYIKQSNEAFETDNIGAALKFAKLAIEANPKSKKAFKTYENIIEEKYKPEEGIETQDEVTSKKPEPEPEEEVAPDMGC